MFSLDRKSLVILSLALLGAVPANFVYAQTQTEPITLSADDTPTMPPIPPPASPLTPNGFIQSETKDAHTTESTEDVAEEISRINENLALLSAQLAELDLQAKIASKEAEIKKIQNDKNNEEEENTENFNNASVNTQNFPALGNQITPASIRGLLTDMSYSEMPSIKEIEGIDGDLKATIYLENGVTQVVRVGDRAGKWTIKEIQVDAVTVQDGDTIEKLGFGQTPPRDALSPINFNQQQSQLP
jgi:type IV pilus biogenesis protein PilP